MQRRTLLRIGLAAGITVSLGAGLLALVRPGRHDGRFTAPARDFYAAVARGVLGPLLPEARAAQEQALQAHLGRLEAAIAGMPPALQAEVDELTTLASSAPGRLGLIGLTTPWAGASAAEVEATLQTLRISSLALRQQVYQALSELTKAAWFADPGTWVALGYQGQRPVPNRPAT